MKLLIHMKLVTYLTLLAFNENRSEPNIVILSTLRCL